jgi:hypothetical protein
MMSEADQEAMKEQQQHQEQHQQQEQHQEEPVQSSAAEKLAKARLKAWEECGVSRKKQQQETMHGSPSFRIRTVFS